MEISKEWYDELTLEAGRYKFLKYEATPEQWARLGNLDSVEEIDEELDFSIANMWGNME